MSAFKNKADVVEWLLSVGADESLRNMGGAAQQTVLEWARKKGHAELVTILVKSYIFKVF